MIHRRARSLNARQRTAAAVSGALLLVMVFAGTVLGHHTLPSASFACNGTVTWHVDDYTDDNTGNQALATDVEAWYSLDGGDYVKLGDFAFTEANFTTGFGGTFDGGSATTVTIKSDIPADIGWVDGDINPADLGPWFSDTVSRVTCDAPSAPPSTAASASPSGGVEAATSRPRPTVPATSTVNQAPPTSPTSSVGFLLILFAVVVLVVGFAPMPTKRRAVNPSIRRRR